VCPVNLVGPADPATPTTRHEATLRILTIELTPGAIDYSYMAIWPPRYPASIIPRGQDLSATYQNRFWPILINNKMLLFRPTAYAGGTFSLEDLWDQENHL